jgi:hypothetical protein
MAKDDVLQKKKAASGGASPQMARLMRFTRTLGILVGGFVTMVGMMSLVGFVIDNFWVRFLLSLIVVVGLPAFISDRFLKRTNMGGGLRMVADIFAILLLGFALVLVSVDFASKPLLVREGDRYARSGSRTMARIVYFLGGVSPVFPEEKSAPPAPSGSASGAPSR